MGFGAHGLIKEGELIYLGGLISETHPKIYWKLAVKKQGSDEICKKVKGQVYVRASGPSGQSLSWFL